MPQFQMPQFQMPKLFTNYSGMNPMATAPVAYGPQPQQAYGPQPQQASYRPFSNFASSMSTGMNNAGTSMNDAFIRARMRMANASKNKSLITGILIFFLLAMIVLLFLVVLAFVAPKYAGLPETGGNLLLGQIMYTISAVICFGMSIMLLFKLRNIKKVQAEQAYQAQQEQQTQQALQSLE